MKASRAKTVLLGTLVVVASYIWWGNVQLLTAPEVPVAAENLQRVISSEPLGKGRIVYREPRINPFNTFLSRSAPGDSSSPTKQLTVAVRGLSASGAQLLGVVGSDKQASAIVRINDSSSICRVGDTVASWQVKRISGTFVALRRERLHDTLWLSNPLQ